MDIVLKYEGFWQVLFSAELFRKSTVIFPEISGKIPPEISELTTLVSILGRLCRRHRFTCEIDGHLIFFVFSGRRDLTLYRVFWTVFIFSSRSGYNCDGSLQLYDRHATPIRRTEVARRSNRSRVATVTAAFTLLVRRTRTRFADSSFAVARPASWNSLPAHMIRMIRLAPCVLPSPKTYLFTVPYWLNCNITMYNIVFVFYFYFILFSLLL